MTEEIKQYFKKQWLGEAGDDYWKKTINAHKKALDKESKESTHYHSIWHKDGGEWHHHFDADTKDDAQAEKDSLKNSGVKGIKVIKVHKDEADWRKPEHRAKAIAKLNGVKEDLNESKGDLHALMKHHEDNVIDHTVKARELEQQITKSNDYQEISKHAEALRHHANAIIFHAQEAHHVGNSLKDMQKPKK